MFLTYCCCFDPQNIFDEIDGSIDSIGPDILEAFISPQLLIGTFAGYTAMASYKRSSGFDRVRYRALKYRYMYGAALDVMMAYEKLGWVSPIFSSDETIPPMLLVEEDLDQRKRNRNSLVYYSRRPEGHFATNIPALINLLFLWLSKQKKLRAKVVLKPTGDFFVDNRGDLLPISKIGKIQPKWFRMKVFHLDKGIKRSIPEALLSLVTDGRHDGKDDGITFENLLLDVDFSTQEALKKRISDMLEEKRDDFARRNIIPTARDLLKNVKELDKDECARGVPEKADAGVAATGVAVVESQEEAVESRNFPIKGQFGFNKGELKKIFQSNNGDATPKEVRTNLDAMISIHAEKLVRLSLARAAEMRIDPSSLDEDFSSSYIQSQDMMKKESSAIMNAFSNDVCILLSAACGWQLDYVMKGLSEEGKEKGGVLDLSESDSLSGDEKAKPSLLECVCRVRDGRVPLIALKTGMDEVCKRHGLPYDDEKKMEAVEQDDGEQKMPAVEQPQSQIIEQVETMEEPAEENESMEEPEEENEPVEESSEEVALEEESMEESAEEEASREEAAAKEAVEDDGEEKMPAVVPPRPQINEKSAENEYILGAQADAMLRKAAAADAMQDDGDRKMPAVAKSYEKTTKKRAVSQISQDSAGKAAVPRSKSRLGSELSATMVKTTTVAGRPVEASAVASKTVKATTDPSTEKKITPAGRGRGRGAGRGGRAGKGRK
jgi:hypothetical protein